MRLAATLQAAILRDKGVTVAVGVGRTRLLARLLSPLHKPAGVSALSDARRAAFLAAQPLARIPKLRGKGGAELRAALGVETVGDLARFSEAELAAHVPRKQAAYLASLPRGGPVGDVEERGPPKSLLAEQSFQQIGSAGALAAHLRPLAATLLQRTVRPAPKLLCFRAAAMSASQALAACAQGRELAQRPDGRHNCKQFLVCGRSWSRQ